MFKTPNIWLQVVSSNMFIPTQIVRFVNETLVQVPLFMDVKPQNQAEWLLSIFLHVFPHEFYCSTNQ